MFAKESNCRGPQYSLQTNNGALKKKEEEEKKKKDRSKHRKEEMRDGHSFCTCALGFRDRSTRHAVAPLIGRHLTDVLRDAT